MALSQPEQNWLRGFMDYFKGVARPTTAGTRQDGWDAANRSAGTGAGIGWGN